MATHSDSSLVDNDRAIATSLRRSMQSEVTIGPDILCHQVSVEEDSHVQGNDQSRGDYTSIPTAEPRKSRSSDSRDAAGIHMQINETEKVDLSYQPLGNLATLGQWKYEFLALLASILAFMSLLILLSLYNREEQPQFAYTVNITTLVAVFTTLLRAAMLFTVAEVIGQSKWLWMAKPRPLRHIEHFDNAGKGVWGSLRILFLTLKPTLASLGALIAITSYAIGPFAQQGVKTYSCDVEGEGIANISIAERVADSDILYDVSLMRLGHGRLRQELQVAALNGLITESQQESLKLFHCDSANCTFPMQGVGVTHISAGICSRCIDVRSDVLEIHLDNRTHPVYGFHQNSDFHIGSSIFNLTSEETSNYGSSRSINTKIEASVLSFTTEGCFSEENQATGRPTGECRHDYDNMPKLSEKSGLVAANCSLYPCLRHYHGSVSNGIFSERLVSTSPMPKANISLEQVNAPADVDGLVAYEDYFAMMEPCIIDNTWYDASNITAARRAGVKWTSWKTQETLHEAPTHCVAFMSSSIIRGFGDLLIGELNGECHLERAAVGGSSVGGSVRSATAMPCEGGLWIDALHNGGNTTFEHISNAFDSMATAITNHMRLKGRKFLTTSRSFALGSCTRATVCLSVDWPWLLYPGILLFLSSVLLGAAYIQSCKDKGRQPVWKSAILPLLFYGVRTQQDHSNEHRDGSGTKPSIPLLQLRELESMADTTLARLHSGRDGAGFVVEKQPSSKGSQVGA